MPQEILTLRSKTPTVRFQAHKRTISGTGTFPILPQDSYLPFEHLVRLHTIPFHLVLCRCSLHQGAGGQLQISIPSREKIQPIVTCRNAPGAGFVPLLPCNHVEFIPTFHTAFWISWIINTGTFYLQFLCISRNEKSWKGHRRQEGA